MFSTLVLVQRLGTEGCTHLAAGAGSGAGSGSILPLSWTHRDFCWCVAGAGLDVAYLVCLKCQGGDVGGEEVAPSLARSGGCAKSCFGGGSEIRVKVMGALSKFKEMYSGCFLV